MTARRLFGPAARAALEEILRARAGKLLVGLDCDGTLAPIVARPERARVSSMTLAAIARAVSLGGVTVAVISARRPEELRALVPVPGVLRVGHYGLDDRRFSAAARRRWRQAARRIAGTASEYAREVPRTWVEAKGYTVAVHDRAVRGRRAGLSRMARKLAALADRFGFRVVRGRRVLELVPREGGKDSAFRALLRRSRATRAVYFGDSEADIPVFTLLQKLSRRARFAALDVQVGHGPTPARYRVGGPADARRFLIALARARSSDPSPRR